MNISNPLLIQYFEKYPEINYSRGDKILRPNEYDNHIYLLKSGYIRIFKLLRSGQEVTFNFYNPKKQQYILLGYAAHLTDYYIEAITNVAMSRASKKDFQIYVEANPELKDFLINELQIYFDEALHQVEWLSVPDAYTRIKILVSSLAKNIGFTTENKTTFDDKTHAGIKVTHNLLASLAGLSRETVTMQINRLITEGYLSRRENALVVEKLDALTADSL